MLFSRYKLKWRLLAGFFVCALITGAGSALAIWILNSTYSDMQATSNQIGAVIDDLNTQSRARSSVRELLTQIETSRRTVALKRCEEKLAAIQKDNAGFVNKAQDDVYKAVGAVIVSKQRELDAADAAHTVAVKADDLMSSLLGAAATVATGAEAPSTPEAHAASLENIKNAQHLQLACYQLDGELKETTHAADTWLLNEQYGRIKTSLASVKTEIARLNDGASKQKLNGTADAFATAADALLKARQLEFETRAKYIADTQTVADLMGVLTLAMQNNSNSVKANVADQLRRNSETVAWWSDIQGVLGVLSLLLAVLLGILIANSLTRDLSRVVDAMTLTSTKLTHSASAGTTHGQGQGTQMESADLTQRLDVIGRDEVAILGQSYNTLIESFLRLVQQIQRSGKQMAAASGQIAGSTRELEAALSEQAASTNEVAATSKEISATSQALVTTMNEVSAVATESAELAGAGKNNLSGMSSTMTRLSDSTNSIASRLSTINDRAAKINAILVTITKLADQTNLLSLNASIEAEKAGEHGLGFGVVAHEVRRLADQSARCTEDIERFIKDMQSAVSAGVMEMDKYTRDVAHGVEEVERLGEQLATIISRVETLAPRFATVNEGMYAQSLGAKQISTAMLQLTEAASQTMNSLRTTAAATQELNSTALGLNEEVKRFKTN